MGSQMTSFKRRSRFKTLWKVGLTPLVSRRGQQRVCWGEGGVCVEASSPLPWSWKAHLPPLQLQVLRRDHSIRWSFLLIPNDTNLKGEPMETTNSFIACQRGSGLQIARRGNPRWFWWGGFAGPRRALISAHSA